jgi:malonate-semialdehyde dehydrogenase (acetylating) / methylmalonate-semialdehyde dehydrogenase
MRHPSIHRRLSAPLHAWPEGVRFYTKQKAVTSRWPTGIRAGAEFKMPTMG